MENFAWLFIRCINLQDSSRSALNPQRKHQEKWVSVDRLVALYGPPEVVNHTWTLGVSSTHKQS